MGSEVWGAREELNDRLAQPSHFYQAQKRQAFRFYLEKGFTAPLVCQEVGVASSCLFRWVWLYRQQAEAGLTDKLPTREQIEAVQGSQPERNLAQ